MTKTDPLLRPPGRSRARPARAQADAIEVFAHREDSVGATLGGRLTGLLFWIRSSGVQVFKSCLNLHDSDLRLISVLGRSGPKTSLQLATILGTGKTQVSRSTAALARRGLIGRPNSRGCFTLTDDGQALFGQLKEIAAERRRTITEGLDPGAVGELMAGVATATKNLEPLLAAELKLAGPAGTEDRADLEGAAAVDMMDHDAFIPAWVTLALLTKRLGAARWRRLGDLSFFSWVVLARVSEAGQMEQSDLVRRTGRDKSQVWRTVAALTRQGYLARRKLPDRRNVMLTATDEGRRIYDLVAADCFQSDDSIMAGLSERQRDLLLGSIDVMTNNAQALLRRTLEQGRRRGSAA